VIDLPAPSAERPQLPMALVLRQPPVAACAAAVVLASATLSMLEPVMALHLGSLGIGPARIGMLFGIASLVNTGMHPMAGHLADRFGARRIMLLGLALSAFAIALLGQTSSFRSTIGLQIPFIVSIALMITPSLAYMAEVTTLDGVDSYGVAYGLYNMAWGVGLLTGPAIGGFLYEWIGFGRLAVPWGVALIVMTWFIARTAGPTPGSAPASDARRGSAPAADV